MPLDGPDPATLIRVDVRMDDAALRARVDVAVGSVSDLVPVRVGSDADVIVTDQERGGGQHPIVAIVSTERIDAALRAGAAFGLPPDAGAAAIRSAIRAAHSGLTGRLRAPPKPVGRDALDGHEEEGAALSPRELEVLQLLAEGASNKLIARRLDISVHTAKFHVGSIMTKLGATTRTDAVARGMRLGLVLL